MHLSLDLELLHVSVIAAILLIPKLIELGIRTFVMLKGGEK